VRYVREKHTTHKPRKKSSSTKAKPDVHKSWAVAAIGLLNNDEKIMNAGAGLQVNANPARIAAAALPVLIRAL